MKNPLSQRSIVSQGTAEAKAEVARVCVHEARADPAIPPVAVNQRQVCRADFPSLLYQGIEQSAVYDLRGMVAMKADLHLRLRFATART